MKDAGEGRTIWWLESGTERCPVCLGSHHYEIRVHCEECDEAICPGCVVDVRVLERTVALCPSCRAESG
jgi:hypothetical protein